MKYALRRRLAAAVAAMALAAGLVGLTGTAPAHAGQGYWSASDCRPDVLWYNENGVYGTHYSYSRGYFFVGGRFMDVYSRWGWQCGVLGAPTSFPKGINPTGWYQTFENGYIYEAYPGCMKVYVTSWKYHTQSCY